MTSIPIKAVHMGTKTSLSFAAKAEPELNHRLSQTEARASSPRFAIMYMCRRQTHLTHAQYAEHYRTVGPRWVGHMLTSRTDSLLPGHTNAAPSAIPPAPRHSSVWLSELGQCFDLRVPLGS
jgi:hypothetical protein